MFYNIKLSTFALAFENERWQRSDGRQAENQKKVKKSANYFASSKTCRTFAKFSARWKGRSKTDIEIIAIDEVVQEQKAQVNSRSQ